MISIAVLTNSTRPSIAVAHSLGIAEALARRGAEVTIHALARSGTRSFYRPVDSMVKVIFHPFPHVEDENVATSTQRSVAVFAKAIQAGNYDVVHAQDDVAARAAPGCIRTILSLDEMTRKEIRESANRFGSEEPTTRVICTSPMMAQQVEPILGEAPAVIPSGVFAQQYVDAASPTVKAISARNQWRTSLPSPFVLALGGVEPDNATIEVLEAVTLARETIPSLQLVVAGGNDTFKHRDYRISLDVRSSELGVQPIILGPIRNEFVASLVAASDVFVDFSKTENFAAFGLEALAAGRPLVCRDITSRREIFSQLARYGRDTSSLSRALLTNLANPSGRVEEGQRLAASHSWDNVAKELVDFYDKTGLLASASLASQ